MHDFRTNGRTNRGTEFTVIVHVASRSKSKKNIIGPIYDIIMYDVCNMAMVNL